MGEVTDYVAGLEEPDRAAVARVYAIARDLAPEATEGTSYGMPTLLHRGKGLVAARRTKKFLSLYPFSGAALASAAEALEDFETTPGSVHFSAQQQLPEETLRRILAARMAEIDG